MVCIHVKVLDAGAVRAKAVYLAIGVLGKYNGIPKESLPLFLRNANSDLITEYLNNN
jgi:transposase-like protein